MGLSYHFIFLGASVVLVHAGLRKGIERGCKILMPILFCLLSRSLQLFFRQT